MNISEKQYPADHGRSKGGAAMKRMSSTQMTAKRRLQAACRSLALAPIRVCHHPHPCCFCEQPIERGEKYRDRWAGLRAHLACFETVNREVNS